MQFTKIKANGKDVHLEWTTPASDKAKADLIHHSLESKELPHPDLVAALDALAPWVAELIEVSKPWAKGLKVIGVSVSINAANGARGFVVSALKELAGANSPLVIHTPHLREASDDENADNSKAADDEFLTKLELIEEQAAHYVEGRRAQVDMFVEAEEPVGAGA